MLQSRGRHVLSGSRSSASPFVPFRRQELRLSCSAAIEIPHRAGPAHRELRHWPPRKKRRSQAVVMIKSGSASASWAKRALPSRLLVLSRAQQSLTLNGSRGNLIYIPGPAFFLQGSCGCLKKKKVSCQAPPLALLERRPVLFSPIHPLAPPLSPGLRGLI